MFESVAGVATLPAGPAVRAAGGAEAAIRLADLDIGTADQSTRLEALALVQRHLAWIASVEASLLASFQVDSDIAASSDSLDAAMSKDWLSEEVGAILRLRSDYARNRMTTASQLVHRLPGTFAELEAGTITAVQARLIADAVVSLPDDACLLVEQRVLPRAVDKTSTQLRKSLARAILAVDPTSAQDQIDEAAKERRVLLIPAEHGMAILWALLPAADAMRLKSAIWQLAEHRRDIADQQARCADEPDSEPGAGPDNESHSIADSAEPFVPIDRYRADALVELGERYLTACDPTGVVNRLAPAVQVVVSIETLIGDSDEPGDLVGHGPIPAELARRIAHDPGGTW